jgi:protein phosphatase PTC7
MHSLTICARLVARAVSGTEAENLLYNSLLRLAQTSSSVHQNQPNHRLALSTSTLPSAAITRAVHLVTASSGYSGHDDDHEHLSKTSSTTTTPQNSSRERRTSQSNVYGDDAFFITKHRIGDFLAVADGVGGWREHGVDPSLFSSSLMNACKSLIDNKLIDLNPLTLKELLSKGYKQLLENKQCIVGSSTACIVALHKEKSILHTANLGDSGFVVIRKNAIVHRSQEQQHYFNSPFQLAIHPTIKDPRMIADSPDLASVTSFDVEENDFILVGTDGLWDNLPDATILEEIKKIIKPTLDNLQRVAHALARRALENGHDPHFYSPFAKSAKRSLGINICGGKPDDVTVLLAVVTCTSS